MSYAKGQRVRHGRGYLGTVTRDAADHAVVYVRWDGSCEERQVLPECVSALETPRKVASVRDAWTGGTSNARSNTP